MKPQYLIAVTIFSLFRRCAAAIDFCDADPRLEIKRDVCLGAINPSLLVHVRPVDGNPYHSLHDTLWPVAHYISHCSRRFPDGATALLVQHGQNYKASGCVGDAELPPKGPYWALCAIHALAASVGGRVLGTTKVDILPHECFEKTVNVGVHRGVSKTVHGVGTMRDDFRGMSFFGRTCAGSPDAECDAAVANRSMLIPLPTRLKTNALRYLRNSMMQLVDAAVPSEEPGRKIRVLLYDRNDTSRRQWVNAEPIREMLQKDEGVEVRFVQSTPKSLKGQIELYAWPDVLLAPHGAAMVNTIFMRDGTEVIEGSKLCMRDISPEQFVPNDWTGWHAALMGINVQYVQCHTAEDNFRESHELLQGRHGPPTNGQHKYRVSEVTELLERALERQSVRLRDMESGILLSNLGDPLGVHMKKVINAMNTNHSSKWASRISLLVVAAICVTFTMLRKVIRMKKLPLLIE